MVEYLSVSHLTKYLKLKFDRDPYLEKVYLTGQVSNFRKRPSHQYFSLKDDKAVIQATMWAGVYKNLGFELEEGMKINVIGRIQLYEPNGSYSIVIEKAEPDGIGALAIKFEQLKQALTQEGLFKEEFKQALPRFTKKIGVITSPSGAVIQDIITTVSRRFPGVEIVLYPTKVQGDGAAQEVVANIQRANERDDLDVLIVGRGGGSIEDLWAFNEEIVVRAIFESRIPIISSVGHETDTTLADFVADKRAATPTAAAELATPVTKADLLGYLNQQENRAYQAMTNRLKFLRGQLEKISQSVMFRQPERLYDGYLQKLDRLTNQLQTRMKEVYGQQKQASLLLNQRLQGLQLGRKVESFQERIIQQERLLKSNMANIYDNKMAKADKLIEALTMLDTSRIVARGYAMIRQDGRVIDSVENVQMGENLTIQMKDGQLDVEVKHVQTDENI
ncbi:exodeoxyribonuclease VII large subunit [Streptococcus suis]|uniref:Exodeoxyribonuclease 7 large subunit n=1 Tax=Streptococcus suis R61 TaxID=996306 RepID=A0AA87K3N5_STRSU|nr:exodeoxyribonuclease VII large subunit [Streptococcus suis]ATZ04120.1 exodeoxyribonuclease VII large subunit [Streptococcus suis]EHC02594.1 exodeoxyribonuclease VII large subunit [Streptococcus suis R61]MBY5001410.1 exodeoxyribonuclease VII large subunit [Streptococcus suis]MBY5012466.1 exodeoxyribonuclease VII large subunit [Streptococcus suis]MBY5019285.1 exodeoxyribonuclease VII large subunit [Streptococcus suis]